MTKLTAPSTFALFIYLKTGGDITASAKKLNIHRNTMVHRIEKLFEITRLDLEDGEVRTQLMITYKIMELTESSNKALESYNSKCM